MQIIWGESTKWGNQFKDPLHIDLDMDSHATLEDRNESLAATLLAVERCMRQLELTTTNGPRKKQLNRECQQLLQKAEKIKAGPKAAEGRKRMVEPAPSRRLSTREQIILLKGSKLYGGVFPPWNAAPSAKEFELLACESLYTYVSLTSPNLRNTPGFAILLIISATM